MKINFKKVATVVGSALLMGSTVGMAAAANFPQPFVVGGVADYAVVTGTDAQSSDNTAALTIGNELVKLTTTTTSTTTNVTINEADAFKLAKSSDMLNLGDALTSVYSSIDEGEMKTFLAEGKFVSDNSSDEYEYTQEITFPSTLDLASLNDDDLDNLPNTGITVNDGETVLNYTLSFTDEVPVTDLENSEITILGKKYMITDADSTTGKLTLLDASSTIAVTDATGTTATVDGKTYTVKLVGISSSGKANLLVNEKSYSLAEGSSTKLSDGSYLGVTDVFDDTRETGSRRVEVTIGKGETILEDGEEVTMNDNTVDGLFAYVDFDTSANPDELQSITIKWTAEDKEFLTATNTLKMPGLEGVALSMKPVNYNFGDKIEVATATDKFGLKDVELESGKYNNLYLLYGDAGSFQGIGESSSKRLVTTRTPTTYFEINETAKTVYAIISENKSDEMASYYVKFDLSQDSNNKNMTKITKVDGSDLVSNLEEGDSEDFGNGIRITANDVDGDNGWGNYTLSSPNGYTVSMDMMYTKQGLAINLPVSSGTSTLTGYINLTASSATPTTGNVDVWYMNMTGVDKDGSITASGRPAWSVKIDDVGTDTDKFGPTVVDIMGTTEVVSDKKVNGNDVDDVAYYTATNEMPVQLVLDTSGTDNNIVTIAYPTKEVGAEVYIAPASAVSGGTTTTTTGFAPIKDSEVASATGKNLIVIGGSCVNTLSAQLLGVTYKTCGAEFTAKTGVGAGEALIKSFDRGNNKVALLVAGYEAADTIKAAGKLVASTTDVAAGKGYKVTGTSATDAVLTAM